MRQGGVELAVRGWWAVTHIPGLAAACARVVK